jgi:dTDP-4-amino-4,6-dideoxygalactose transaminase
LPIPCVCWHYGQRAKYEHSLTPLNWRLDTIQAAVPADGIETGIHYPIPLHRQLALAALGYPDAAFPQTERLAAWSLSLPMYPELTLDDVDLVTASIRRQLRDRRQVSANEFP